MLGDVLAEGFWEDWMKRSSTVCAISILKVQQWVDIECRGRRANLRDLRRGIGTWVPSLHCSLTSLRLREPFEYLPLPLLVEVRKTIIVLLHRDFRGQWYEGGIAMAEGFDD